MGMFPDKGYGFCSSACKARICSASAQRQASKAPADHRPSCLYLGWTCISARMRAKTSRARLAASRRPAASARAMRWILVEHARQRATGKRGGDQVMVSLDDRIPDAPQARTSMLALEQGLQALDAISPRRRQIVELRWLAGMEFAEIASMLDISERTVYREWDRARAFLQAMLDDEAGGGACDGA